MFESMVSEKVKAAYFIGLATLMYFFLEEYLDVGVYVTYRHIFALLLVASAFVCFLIRPNIARGAVAVKSGLVFSVPVFLMIFVSMFIWIVEQTDFDLISRGLSYYLLYFNWISAAFAGAAFLYAFGEKGLWYNLLALLIANGMKIVQIMLENGVGVYFGELWTLIRTFAGETGNVIVQAEIHELAFCVGTYLVYMLLIPKKKTWFAVLLGAAAFFFLSAFKRIAIIAIAAAVGIGWLMRLLEKAGREKAVSRLLDILMILTVAVLFVYIVAVKLGLFQWLELQGVETSGRASIYERVGRFYEFSPAFLGHGMGYLTYQLNQNISLGVTAVHNDFLQFYIDLGFWGYLAWLCSMTILRTRYFGRKNTENKIVAAMVLLYLIIVSSTDNTLNYPLFHTAVSIIIMGHGFDQRVVEQEDKMFGYVSAENKLRSDRSMP